MDITSIGAALALTDGSAAIKAAEAANEAAAAANEAAEGYSYLSQDATIDRSAFNFMWTLMQAELRDVQKRLDEAETKLNALT